jgi:hypothetical protein
MKNAILKNITDKADELARQYNKTKDPGIRDQWFKLIKTRVPVLVEKEHKYILDKTYIY